MRSLIIACIAAAAIFTSGCGGSSAITPASANAPAQIRSAAFSPQPGNSSEVTEYITVARDLINQMFAKLQFKPADEGSAPPSATPENSPQATALTSQPAARPNKTNGIQVSKNEYAAREQARALQCNAQ